MIEVDEKYLRIGDGLRDIGRITRKTIFIVLAVIGVVLSFDFIKKDSIPEFRAAEKAYHERCYYPNDGKKSPPRLKEECR